MLSMGNNFLGWAIGGAIAVFGVFFVNTDQERRELMVTRLIIVGIVFAPIYGIYTEFGQERRSPEPILIGLCLALEACALKFAHYQWNKRL